MVHPKKEGDVGLDKVLGVSRNDIATLLVKDGICIRSPTDECTQFDEYLVRRKAITITLYKIGGVGDDTSFGRWQTTMAHGMRLLDETRQSNSID